MTSSNGNIFRLTGPLCEEFTGPGEFSTQRPVTRSFDVFFDLRLNKRLSKQPWGWWFETPSWSLWRHCNVIIHSTDNTSWSGTCVPIGFVELVICLNLSESYYNNWKWINEPYCCYWDIVYILKECQFHALAYLQYNFSVFSYSNNGQYILQETC